MTKRTRFSSVWWPVMTLSLAACSQASPDPAPAEQGTPIAAATTAAPAEAKAGCEGRAGRKEGRFGHKDPAAFVARFDANGDGTLELAELPEHKREKLSSADTNKDQKLSVEELKTHFANHAERHRASDNGTTQVM